jgi:leucyl-tRNA synthetase
VRRLAHEALRRFDAAFRGDFAFNTGIAGVYEFLNAFPEPEAAAAAPEADRRALAEALRLVVRSIAPVAPHLAEELHEALGGTGTVFRTPWPAVDPGALRRDTIEIAIQVNGKVRSRIEVPADLPEDAVREAVLADPRVREWVAGKPVRRVIVVPGRLANVIV